MTAPDNSPDRRSADSSQEPRHHFEYRFEYWLLQGAVQGCGLRPSATAFARNLQLQGWICNTAYGVLLALHGPPARQAQLLDKITSEFSGTATPLQLNTTHNFPSTPRQTPTLGNQPFFIRHSSELSTSEHTALASAIRQLPETTQNGPAVPTDLAICSHCLLEIQQPHHPRADYPLNSCARCGPRYSVLRKMPWDREHTALQPWPLCEDCTREYNSLGTQRSHAQIINCPRCGPQLQSLSSSNENPLTNQQLIQHAADCLRQNRVLALQGIGGWQLLCNAASSAAVQRLRDIKQRPHKPLPVMIPSLDCLCEPLSTTETEILQSPQNPILICNAKLHSQIAPNVRGLLHSIGLFLPSTALHHLILKHFNQPVVVSSANFEDDPILFTHSDVIQQLQHRADFLLGHERPILRPVDDSVVRVIGGHTSVLRLARGFAPLPLPLASAKTIVALGGHQKAAFAIAGQGRAILGPHIGDLSSEATRLRFLQQLQDTLELYQLQPDLLVHDLHPDYFTTAWARSTNVPTLAVQHHHAHAAAALLDHHAHGPALAAVFDGSGYSPDGVVRGGEFLLANRLNCQHVACLMTFNLPAPDAAAREPWRSAVALIHHSMPHYSAIEIAQCFAQRPLAQHFGPPPNAADIQPLLNALAAGAGTPCSSMGRLFDALACIILGTHSSPFEANAAILLEEAATLDSPSTNPQHPPLLHQLPLIPLIPLQPSSPPHTTASSHHSNAMSKANGPNTTLTADWRPLLRFTLQAAEQGRAPAELSRIVHSAIARLVLDVSSQFPTLPVILTGGCFQNRLLTEYSLTLLQQHHRKSFPPRQIPVNDAGLAAGQLAIAQQHLA